MTDWEGDVLVIGAGPAGLAAAASCARAGLRVLLADENQRPGGQIARRRFRDPAAGETDPVPAGVDYRPGTVCHGFRDGAAVFTGPPPAGTAPARTAHGDTTPGDAAGLGGGTGVAGGSVSTGEPALWTARARRVVLATGASERVLPVPGWTLPGVLTSGAAQTFLKGSGTFPYRRVLVAGSGPLLLAVAVQLIEAGVEVAAVAEAARPGPRHWRDALHALAAPGLLAQGAGYLTRLARAGVRVRTGTGVRRIEGGAAADQWRGDSADPRRGDSGGSEPGVRHPAGDGVTGAVLGRLQSDWTFADDREERVACDAVLLGHGFSSTTELAAQYGAEIAWDDRRQTWAPVRDAGLRAGHGLRVVGDCAGVGGAQRAVLEGRLAGELLAAELTGRAAGPSVPRLRRGLARIERFRLGMDRIYRPEPGTATWPDPETPVCRCQGTTRAEIDTALHNGAGDLRAVKLWTRAGMGACQGRVCAPILRTLTGPDDPPTARFPVRPLPIAALAAATPEPSAAPRPGADGARAASAAETPAPRTKEPRP